MFSISLEFSNAVAFIAAEYTARASLFAKYLESVYSTHPNCTVTENIRTPPTEGIGISWRLEGSVRPNV